MRRRRTSFNDIKQFDLNICYNTLFNWPYVFCVAQLIKNYLYASNYFNEGYNIQLINVFRGERKEEDTLEIGKLFTIV